MSNAVTIFESNQLPEFLSKRQVMFVYIDGGKVNDKLSFFLIITD